MTKVLAILLLFCVLSIHFSYPTFAAYDPLSRPNNLYGIHILFPEELNSAAQLVNSNGGEWGYVTIPIQMGERNLEKWQTFMNNAYKLHLIPIVRLATEAFYKDTKVWRIPTEYDIIDFANFLDSLWWPTKNRYIILFNEVNRFDEWGGNYPDPKTYSALVDFAVETFKGRSEEFFIILGGLDNAAPSDGQHYMNEFDYLLAIASYRPTLFEKLDGFASHSYPNPHFSQPPSASERMGTSTYNFERAFINSFAATPKPVFITETGWSREKVDEKTIAEYFHYSFEEIWKKDSDVIVAVTPFLLRSDNGGFDIFSFLQSGNPTLYYTKIQSLSKIRGEPLLNELPDRGEKRQDVTETFQDNVLRYDKDFRIPGLLKSYLETMLGIN